MPRCCWLLLVIHLKFCFWKSSTYPEMFCIFFCARKRKVCDCWKFWVSFKSERGISGSQTILHICKFVSCKNEKEYFLSGSGFLLFPSSTLFVLKSSDLKSLWLNLKSSVSGLPNLNHKGRYIRKCVMFIKYLLNMSTTAY